MEIPLIDRISSFESEINRLQNPSLLSRIFHQSRFEEISQIRSFWTWGALILAFIATFSSIIKRTKFVIFRIWKGKSVISEPLLSKPSKENNEEDDDPCSSSSSSDEEDEPISPWEEDSRVAGYGNFYEHQGQNGNFKMRSSGESFSSSDLGYSKSVVKSWEGLGLGLGLGFEDSSGNQISLWHLSKNQITSSFYGQKCPVSALSMPSPTVTVSAGLENSRNLALRVWDARVGRQIPEILTEWRPRRRKVVGIDSGGVEKIYVRNDGNSVLVKDIRNVGSTLGDFTESDVKTWWDADAVIVDGDRELCFDELPKNGCGSVVSRCRNAVLSYLV